VLVGLADPAIYVTTEPIGTPVYRGHDGVRKMLHDIAAAWETLQLEVVEFREHGDQVFIDMHATAPWKDERSEH
jgi:ketosteroid isomerase-like protein